MADQSRLSDIDRLFEAVSGLQRSLQCTICLEIITDPTKTRCGHSFCKACIGQVVQRKNASCPLCKKSLNRRNVSKDDDLQTYIEMFNGLVAAIQSDSHIDILSHSKQPRDTKESCFYPDSNRDCKKEKPSEKQMSKSKLNQNTNKRTDKPSTSRGTMIDRGNPRHDLNMSGKKPETLSSRLLDDVESSIPPDIKIRTWLHMVPDKLSSDDWIMKNEVLPIEDKAEPTNPIFDDNGKSDELGEVYRDGIDASCRPSQDRKRSIDCPERTGEDDTLSQVNKRVRQIGEVIEIDSDTSELKYNASHARVRAKKSRGKNVRSKTNIEERINQDSSSSSHHTDQEHRIAASVPSCPNTSKTSAVTEQSTTNWSRMIEFGKEMKRARKRKVKKLNVSTEKNKNSLRIVEDIMLSPNSKYDSVRIAANYDTGEKRTDASNELESAGRKQNAIKNLDVSDAKVKASSETKKDKTGCSKSAYLTMNTSYITLEEGRQIGLINMNNDRVSKTSSLETKDSQYRHHEGNTADYRDLSPSQQKELTPEEINESVRKGETIRNVSQTSAGNFGSSSCLPAEKRTPEPQEANNVQRTSGGAAQLQSPTPNKNRLSLRRKVGNDANKSVDSSPLSDLPLSGRLLVTDKREECISDRSVHSPGLEHDEMFDRLKVVRRDLNFKMTCEDEQRTDRDTVPASTLKNTIEDGNVSRVARQNRKLSRNVTSESTVSKKSLSTKSKSIENRGRRSHVKFMQLGSLIKRRNINFFLLGKTKHELSMPAEVRVTPVYNMQQLVGRFEMHDLTSPNPWNDSQNSDNITVVENICIANNLNSNETVSKKAFPATSPIYRASATSTPKKDFGSHLNQEKSATVVRSSTNTNEQSDKLIKGANKGEILETISHTRPGMSSSVKLLSPDKDSQLKFLEIDSPMTEREELRRAKSIKSITKGNNFSTMKSSHVAAPTLNKAQEPLVESSYKKRKRIRCASDRELFENGSSDDSTNLVSDSSKTTIKLDKYSKLSKKAKSSRLDTRKKRRLSSSDNQDVEIISISKKEDTPERKFKTSSSDTESESMANVTKNSKRYSDGQRNPSITNTITEKSSMKQDPEDLRIQNIADKWNREHDMTQKKLAKESKNTQNSIKSTRNPSGENLASQQSSRSSNALKMEKHKNSKSSQKSFARESDMFESNSLFNSENLDYILQQSTRPNADYTSKKTMKSSNEDIINRVLQIDRSRDNVAACRPLDSVPRNDITSQREKDSRECLLQDNFDEIIASVEQPQSEDFIPCTKQPDRNSNRPLAKQKTSNCLAMTDESCGVIQEPPVVPSSSMSDMFEHYSPRNIRKSPTTNAVSSNSDKENVASSEKRHGYVGDHAIDKGSRKKIVSKYNVSQEKEKFLEKRNTSIQSAGRLHVDNDETQKATAAGNESNLKDDTFEHDSLMNITQHQAQLQMFEQDLFGITDRALSTATKIISQDDLSQKEQRTPKTKKRNNQNKNMELGERSADEDDIVENTPEKKMKNSESRESTKIAFLSPISSIADQTPNTPRQMARSSLKRGASIPTSLLEMRPTSQSTPIVEHSIIVTVNRPSVFEGSKRIERVESGSTALLAIDTRRSENIHWQPERRELCFVCSGLSTGQIATVKEFAARYNANYVNQFDRDVTHVIVNTTGEQNTAKSTLKYLQGIAHRKWVVSYRWIEDSNRRQKLLDELAYEATTQIDIGVNGAGPRNSRLRDKGLFDGFTFLCIGPYDNVSQGQYQDLLLATGAAVVDSLEVLAKMEGMRGVVIQDSGLHDDKAIETWYRNGKAAPIHVDWIVECIGQYKLLKLAPFIQCLSPQHFCAIGYPRELVQDDDEYSYDE